MNECSAYVGPDVSAHPIAVAAVLSGGDPPPAPTVAFRAPARTQRDAGEIVRNTDLDRSSLNSMKM